MAARTTPALDLDTVLKDAKEKVTAALTAARAELAEHEAKLAPLKDNIAQLEQALARLDGTPAPATRRSLTDQQRAERAAKRRARREAKKTEAAAAS
jgi:chromosome segregation ATPase